MPADQLKRSPRKSFERIAWIEQPAGSPLVNCVIDNISDTGAKLLFKTAQSLPDEFFLWFSADGRVARRCQVAWRSSRELGVRFTERPVRSLNGEIESIE